MNIRNPRTGQYDYTIAPPDTAAIAELAMALRAAQPAWASAGVAHRIAVLQDWRKAVDIHKPALIAALTADTGRHWETLLEVDLVATSIDRWCGIAADCFGDPQRRTTAIPFLDLQQELAPYSLVGVISPWNFPLLLSLIDTIPALLAGAAVLVKPSEVTPRFITVLAATIAAVPALASVLRYIEGDGATGAALVAQADLVCFTGSTATGRKVYAAASERMIPVFLELGGKDPAIVLEGADLDRATSAILWGSTANAGQSCLSIERIYVQDSVFNAFVTLLVKKAAALRLNATDLVQGQIGPIIFEKQVAIINDHLQDALAKGATIVYGDKTCQLINGGYYCRPVVLTGVNHSMKIMTEESFGPLLPVMPFTTIEEAVSLANGTMYGLSGAVFAATTEAAMAVAQQLIGGAISLNDCALTAVMHEGEKNAFKLSGIGGTRMGSGAIKRFMRQKVYLINTGASDPWWYDARPIP
jgi:succinate-semialdehyde dehydrogenase / glutarate-semialdehyde dehydrogenase